MYAIPINNERPADRFVLPVLTALLIGLPAVVSASGAALLLLGQPRGLAALLLAVVLAWSWRANHEREDETGLMLAIWSKSWLAGAPIGATIAMAI